MPYNRQKKRLIFSSSNMANVDKIRELIAKGEVRNTNVEFKKCKNEVGQSVYETICAFLNRNGGDVLRLNLRNMLFREIVSKLLRSTLSLKREKKYVAGIRSNIR